MRTLAILLLATVLIAPGLHAEDGLVPMHGCEEDPTSPECHDHEENEAPGLGVVGLLAAVGAVAFLTRRQ